MDDEQKQLKAVSKANKAKATLENESIRDAFEYLTNEYISRWKQCEAPDGRDRLWQGVQVLEKVKEHLAIAIKNGAVSKAILDKLAEDRRKAA